MRLDKYVAEKLDISRERAQLLIRKGLVLVNGEVMLKSSFVVKDEEVDVKGMIDYVSRGYLKLEKAMDEFGVDVNGLRVLDVGASTGGFTQLLLERGAREIVAVDVGHDQMVEKLKNDNRVISKEGVNIKDVTPEIFDLVVVDLSFISLTKVSNHLSHFINREKNGKIVCLVKPQFELGSRLIGKRGVVKSSRQIKKAFSDVVNSFNSAGLMLLNSTLSPIKGKSGNIEILALFGAVKEELCI